MKKLPFVLIATVLAGCNTNHPTDLTEKSKGTARDAETVKIKKGTLGTVIKLPGELKPFEKIDVYPKVNGFVKDIFVDRGSLVKRGQVLMTLDAPEIEQQLLSARAKLIQAQDSLNSSRDRYLRLSAAAKNPGTVSDLDLVAGKSKFEADSAFEKSAEANVSEIQAMKDYLSVMAPFSGIIVERNIHPGALTGPNFKMDSKPLLVLEDNSKLRLEVFIPEEYSEKVKLKDESIQFTTPAWPGKTFHANVSRASDSLYDNYRSEAVEADVPNPDSVFMPGMYVEASVKVTAKADSYLVPTSAIIVSTEGKYVVAARDGKAKFVKISDGIANDGLTEVTGEFTDEELVLKQPSGDLKDGSALH